MPELDLYGLYFCRWQYEPPKVDALYRITRINGCSLSLRPKQHSRATPHVLFRSNRTKLIVTDSATDQKLVCDFLLVSRYTVFRTVSYRGKFVILSLLTGLPLFNSLVRGEPLNSGLRDLAKKLETSLYRVVHTIGPISIQ